MILKRENVEKETENPAVIGRLKAEGYKEVSEKRKARSTRAKKQEGEASDE